MKKKPVKKQSSARVSSIAAKHLRRIRSYKLLEPKYWGACMLSIRADHLAALCGSALSQDEQPSRRKAGRK